jgi:hypothetical protein
MYYICVMVSIVEAMVIERDEDTKRLDGTALLSTANIKLVRKRVPIVYDLWAVSKINERMDVVVLE